jgi:hypothetical protein
VRFDEFDVRDAVLGGEPPGLRQLCTGHVDAEDATALARLARGEEAVRAGAAAKVDDRLAGRDACELGDHALVKTCAQYFVDDGR